MGSFSLVVLLFAGLLAFLLDPREYDHSGSFISSKDNVLLLTAHPDDECMFFAPTMLALATRQEPSQGLLYGLKDGDGAVLGNGGSPQVYSACLSVGNADGLGDVRKGELKRSLGILGVPDARSWVFDHPELKDNFTAIWDAAVIAEVVKPIIEENNISVILTFDDGGVSGHPNHRSLPKGAIYLVKSSPSLSHVRVYALLTVSLTRKYAGILSPVASIVSNELNSSYLKRLLRLQYAAFFRYFGFGSQRNAIKQPRVFVSGIWGYIQALKAMKEHWSQLVWFRWLYVSFSRYMWVNEWVAL